VHYLIFLSSTEIFVGVKFVIANCLSFNGFGFKIGVISCIPVAWLIILLPGSFAILRSLTVCTYEDVEGTGLTTSTSVSFYVN